MDNNKGINKPVRPSINKENTNVKPNLNINNSEDDELLDFGDSLDFNDTPEQQTPVQPTPVQPTPVQPTPVQPTPVQQKKPVQPKKPVQNKKVQQNKQSMAQPKQEQQNSDEQNQTEQSLDAQQKIKKPVNKKKIMIIAAIALVFIIIAVVAVMLLTKDSGKNIKIVENVPPYNIEVADNQVEHSVSTNSNETEETEVIEDASKTVINAVEQSESNPLKLGDYTELATIVNTKTASDKNYIDHESKVYVRMSQVVTGYDNVIPFIDEYNQKGNTIINIPDKETYLSQSNGSDLVMFEIEILYPEDYPTNASAGVIYSLPTLNMALYGKVTDIDSEDIEDGNASDYIVVDKTIYKIAENTSINIDTEEASAGGSLLFRYVTSIPGGASNDVYGVKTDITLNDKQYTVYFEGALVKVVDVPNNNIENTEETLSENSNESLESDKNSEESTEQ